MGTKALGVTNWRNALWGRKHLV